MKMERYTVRFVTPAFLGDAEQKGAWRTPPFKALLREWWRILKAKECGYSHQTLREQEGMLFGHAWLGKIGGTGSWAMKSRVLLRLSHWREGKLSKWQGNEPKVFHPEVGSGGRNVGAHLYLGYGPLVNDKATHQTVLKAQWVIESKEEAEVTIGFPEEQKDTIESALQLVHWFGTIGGRSRNGWGSLVLDGESILGFDALNKDHEIIKSISRPLGDCLREAWPHALGIDSSNRPLVWRTKAKRNTWSETVRDLAKLKITYRIALEFTRNKDPNSARIDKRHLLAFPVTHHGVTEWSEPGVTDRQGYLKPTERLANQLRYKVAKDQSGHFAIVYHLPCKLPEQLINRIKSDEDREWVRRNEKGIWQKVHSVLDNQASLIRI